MEVVHERCCGLDITAARSFFRSVLEQRLELLLVSAQHLKAVPGRKTDVKDAEWVADLLRHGQLKPSFVPDRDQRELRELVRYRTSLVQDGDGRRESAAEGARVTKNAQSDWG